MIRRDPALPDGFEPVPTDTTACSLQSREMLVMSETIAVRCFTNEDNLKLVQWPVFLSVRPLIGERISSVDGMHSRKIVSIEHVANRSPILGSFLALELTK